MVAVDLGESHVVVTGGEGFLGSAVVRELHARGVRRVAVVPHADYDLREPEACAKAVSGADVVIHAAGNVGGIGYNQAHPAELFYDNALMGIHLLEAARRKNVKKVVLIGTVCAYPKFTTVPFREEDLWTGYPEETNAPYGLAKRMLLVQAQAYRQQFGLDAIYLLPTNLYGPGDAFGDRAHVIPALIERIAEAARQGAPKVDAWGDGSPTREFLFVDDAARGIVNAAAAYSGAEPVNLGTGREISIRELAQTIARMLGYRGQIVWQATRPNGQPRRCLDVSRAKAAFGFEAATPFEEGLKRTIAWYRNETPGLGVNA